MDSVFDKIDPQVIFVIVAVAIAGAQALIERVRKRRAEQELHEDVGRRVEQRRARGGEGSDAVPGSFEELYDEYRRQILEDQNRPAGEEPTFTSPWREEPPVPTPPPLPVQPPTPARPQAASAPWQPPKVRRAEEILSPEQQRAAAAFELREGRRRRGSRRPTNPLGRLLADRRGLRDAIVLREVLGPPKGLQ